VPAVKPLLALIDPASKSSLELTVAGIRSLAQIGAPEAVAPIAALAGSVNTHPNVRMEAVVALGAMKSMDGLPTVQDLWTDDWPELRAAALRAAAAIDRDAFMAVLAGMEPDRHWRVRAALADTLGDFPAELATERVRAMLKDEDKRVIPSVLTSLTRLKAADLRTILVDRLADPDYVVRATASRELGKLKAEGGADLLRQAYKTAQADAAYTARRAGLEARVTYGAS
jgi:HEAT repeat protein